MMNGIMIATAAATGPSMSIPAPYWLFTFLHWLTFTLHLIAMNMLFGGLILLLLSKKSAYRNLMFDTQRRLFPPLVAATITLGVAPLLFLQVIYGRFFYTATIIQGWNWFLVIPVVIITYYLLYIVALRDKMKDRTRIDLLVLAMLGLVYVSFTFTMLSDLAVKPDVWGALYKSSPAGDSLNPALHQTIFRWLHMVSGAIAVAGFVVLLYTLYHPKYLNNRDLMKYGARMYMLGVVKAAVFGVIYLFMLGSAVLNAYLKSPGLHALLLGIAVNIAAVLMVYRSVSSSKPKPLILGSAILVFIGVFSMVMARHFLRLVYLGADFSASTLEIVPQWSPLIMFLITFVIGLGVMYWMFKKYFGTPAPADE